jgi:transposase
MGAHAKAVASLRLLEEAAHAAAHTKDTYLSAQYRRLAARIEPKKAMVAVGHSMLVIIYHVLHHQQSYQELGGNSFEERDRQDIEKCLVRRLEKLGYQVVLQSAPPAA